MAIGFGNNMVNLDIVKFSGSPWANVTDMWSNFFYPNIDT